MVSELSSGASSVAVSGASVATGAVFAAVLVVEPRPGVRTRVLGLRGAVVLVTVSAMVFSFTLSKKGLTPDSLGHQRNTRQEMTLQPTTDGHGGQGSGGSHGDARVNCCQAS